ncbi:MAG: hypothetical protein ACM3SQ_13890 [Betaproteobacteria bacterium]
MSRIFLLSPANCRGRRAAQVSSPRAQFPLARALRGHEGAPLGETFAFISGLYFRGKLAYAERFAAPPGPADAIVGCGVHIITPNAGLQPPDARVTPRTLHAFAGADVTLENGHYRRPLERSARALAAEIGADCEVVLLGSVASPKYVQVLTPIFGARLRFPLEFVGRGDMSRGGLLLRHVRAGRELDYGPVAGAVVHGPRPPKLQEYRIAGLQDGTGR